MEAIYDKSLVVDYVTDDEYRAKLLAVFRATNFEGLTAKMEALFKAVECPELQAKALTLSEGFPPELGFYMLFSFDEFKTTHSTLQQV
jgi:hypothetical protein